MFRWLILGLYFLLDPKIRIDSVLSTLACFLNQGSMNKFMQIETQIRPEVLSKAPGENVYILFELDFVSVYKHVTLFS